MTLEAGSVRRDPGEVARRPHLGGRVGAWLAHTWCLQRPWACPGVPPQPLLPRPPSRSWHLGNGGFKCSLSQAWTRVPPPWLAVLRFRALLLHGCPTLLRLRKSRSPCLGLRRQAVRKRPRVAKAVMGRVGREPCPLLLSTWRAGLPETHAQEEWAQLPRLLSLEGCWGTYCLLAAG